MISYLIFCNDPSLHSFLCVDFRENETNHKLFKIQLGVVKRLTGSEPLVFIPNFADLEFDSKISEDRADTKIKMVMLSLCSTEVFSTLNNLIL
jgi:hypothetical protein